MKGREKNAIGKGWRMTEKEGDTIARNNSKGREWGLIGKERGGGAVGGYEQEEEEEGEEEP